MKRRRNGNAPAETVPRAGEAPAALQVITLRSYQEEATWRLGLRRLLYLWRRQSGKSTSLGAEGLRRMMLNRNRLVVFGSASILLGTEFIRKEAELWLKFLDTARAIAAEAGMLLKTSGDDLDLDAVCDLFEHSKLETKLFHDRTSYSRSKVVAPNPDTAVGWTGDVFLDEVGRVPELKGVLEALLPIMENNPQFILRMATTPPPDDAHYSWELFAPEERRFSVNARGNWYRSRSGILVHRADVFDTYLAGLPCFHPDTGAPITPAEHRALAFDKSAWDRNYALEFLSGGTAAVSLASIARAMMLGADQGAANYCTEEVAVA